MSRLVLPNQNSICCVASALRCGMMCEMNQDDEGYSEPDLHPSYIKAQSAMLDICHTKVCSENLTKKHTLYQSFELL
jgi:hypothetical protein